MATAELPTAAPPTMTVEEFLALPADGVDRELIYGVVREKGMTVRNEVHSLVMANVARHLGNWAAGLSEFRVLCGEAGFILDEIDRLIVGVDVAINRSALVASRDTSLIRGAPYLAVEILSPSDTQGDIHEKTRLYLSHGTSAVWIVDPDDQSVRIYRKDALPQFFSGDQPLTCEPELPGLTVRTSDLFR